MGGRGLCLQKVGLQLQAGELDVATPEVHFQLFRVDIRHEVPEVAVDRPCHGALDPVHWLASCSHVSQLNMRTPGILTGGVPFEAPGLVSFLGWTVSKSTGAQQTSPLDRHHPTETLETVRFDVSNVPRGLLGHEMSQVEGRPSWPSGVPHPAADSRENDGSLDISW